MAQQLMNLTSIHEDMDSIPGLAPSAQGSGVAVSCGVGHRCGLDPALLWLWYRPAATAVIPPLVWELPNTMRVDHNPPQKSRFQNYVYMGVPVVVQWLTNPIRNHKVVGSIPGFAQWIKDPALL